MPLSIGENLRDISLLRAPVWVVLTTCLHCIGAHSVVTGMHIC